MSLFIDDSKIEEECKEINNEIVTDIPSLTNLYDTRLQTKSYKNYNKYQSKEKILKMLKCDIRNLNKKTLFNIFETDFVCRIVTGNSNYDKSLHILTCEHQVEIVEQSDCFVHIDDL